MVVLLSVAVAWLIFDRFEQQRRFESLVSHVNAIEEGAVLRVEFDGLAGQVAEFHSHEENIASMIGAIRREVSDLKTEVKVCEAIDEEFRVVVNSHAEDLTEHSKGMKALLDLNKSLDAKIEASLNVIEHDLSKLSTKVSSLLMRDIIR